MYISTSSISLIILSIISWWNIRQSFVSHWGLIVLKNCQMAWQLYINPSNYCPIGRYNTAWKGSSQPPHLIILSFLRESNLVSSKPWLCQELCQNVPRPTARARARSTALTCALSIVQKLFTRLCKTQKKRLLIKLNKIHYMCISFQPLAYSNVSDRKYLL